jgi:hypothetical protein
VRFVGLELIPSHQALCVHDPARSLTGDWPWVAHTSLTSLPPEWLTKSLESLYMSGGQLQFVKLQPFWFLSPASRYHPDGALGL